MRVTIAGGGTGGHLYPGLAVAEAIRDRYPESRIFFIGTKRGIESWVVPTKCYDIDFITIGGFLGKNIIQRVWFPFQMVASLMQSICYLRRRKPDVVLGTGGYVSAPPVMAAWILGVPAAMLALDAMPSQAVRMLSRIAKEIYGGFPECADFIKERHKVIFTGNPLRSDLGRCSREEGIRAFGLDPNRKTILVYGGSHGAHSINQAISQAILARGEKWFGYQFIVQTGKRDWEMMSRDLTNAKPRIVVLPYIENMAAAFAASDLVISRSGSTVSEILACGLPSILIPYPYAASNHQEYNARSLEKAGAAVVIRDSELTAERLIMVLESIINDEDLRKRMSDRAKSQARPQAAQQIAERLKELTVR